MKDELKRCVRNGETETAGEAGLGMVIKNLLSVLLGALLAIFATGAAHADAIYQWSVPVGGVSAETAAAPEAYLWIAPQCAKVSAVVLAQHNLLEEPLLEHPRFRRTLAKACIAEVWVTPMFDMVFDFPNGAGERFQAMMTALAQESGYGELATAPIVPVGHSAAASFPWNFAAWGPSRTLAIISLKGDAPLTPMSGSGKPNPLWGARDIDGVPALMIMGEYEWHEERLAPALAYQAAHPKAAISLYADAGQGHFDLSDALIDYIGRFIEKAARARLPADGVAVGAQLKAIDPSQGWRADRWRPDGPTRAPAAPASRYAGPRQASFWYFDREMAERAQVPGRSNAGKQPQLLGFIQNGALVQPQNSHAQIVLVFESLSDGISFKLAARALEKVPGGGSQPATWTGRAPGETLGHASGPIKVTRETGPVVKTGPDTWKVSFNRVGFDNRKRSGDVWFVASQAGDGRFKSASQQAIMRVPVSNTVGVEQVITFDLPAHVGRRAVGGKIALTGTSDQGLPISYYVRRGPAAVRDGALILTRAPRSAKGPLKVTVVAWQLGLAGKVKSAKPVERTVLVSD